MGEAKIFLIYRDVENAGFAGAKTSKSL